jgi:hypothetical protein
MHDKQRYVKLEKEQARRRLISPAMTRLAFGAVFLSALLAPSLTHAENVPGSAGATDSLLAVGTDGLPRVAFAAANGSVALAARAADGTWAEQTLPGTSGALKLGYPQVAQSTVEMLIIQNPQSAVFSIDGTLARPLETP